MRNGKSSAGTSDTESPLLFREVQRFRQWFLWVPALVVTGVIWWQFVEQVVRGNPQGTEPIPDYLAWILTLVFGVGIPVFMAFLRLVTEVRLGLLSVGLAPFRSRLIPVHEIHGARSREYSPMAEFGGWGIRTASDGSRAYNAYGTMGVQLTLTDGSRILVGTQRAEELLAALRAAGAKID
ncbi:MAG: DUF6141 family protein [Thermoleophilia bacterium]|jgi:hypothetical protein